MQSVRPLQAPAAAPLKSCREIEEEEQEEGEAEAENQRNERMYRLDLSPVLNTRLLCFSRRLQLTSESTHLFPFYPMRHVTQTCDNTNKVHEQRA